MDNSNFNLSDYMKALSKEKSLDFMVDMLLHDLGISNGLLGFDYIHDALILLCKHPDRYRRSISNTLYFELAVKHKTTNSRVERNIRSAIEKTWTIGNLPLTTRLFSYSIRPDKGKPSNAEFLFTLLKFFETLFAHYK